MTSSNISGNEPTDPTPTGAVDSPPPELPADAPTPARVYGMSVGGLDDFDADQAMAGNHPLDAYPEFIDIARENRRFLYRAVRFLARDCGIRQFLDLGSGLPSQDNVHEIAQEFQPSASVVYVDNDPAVLLDGKAQLEDNPYTAFIAADITTPEAVLGHPETRRLIDFAAPVAVLMFSIPHLIPDDAAALRTIREPLERAVPGSFLALSHVVSDDDETRRETSRIATETGMPWKTRSPADVTAWVTAIDLEPMPPGLGDVNDWRPDPNQPELAPPHPAVGKYIGAAARRKLVYEYGGVLRVLDRSLVGDAA